MVYRSAILVPILKAIGICKNIEQENECSFGFPFWNPLVLGKIEHENGWGNSEHEHGLQKSWTWK